jgi:predicted MPP superfamily phosphohydrolase
MYSNTKSPHLFNKIKFSLMEVAARRLDGHINKNQFNPNIFDITHIDLRLDDLDPQFDGYRLVQFSDIHIGTWINRKRLAGVVELVNQLSPDLVAITGDFVTFNPGYFADDLTSTLRLLHPKDASVAVLGNHDHWAGPEVIRQVLVDSGVIDLSNTVFTVERQSAQLHLAGVDDVVEQLDCLDDVIKQIPETGAAILLAHEPDFADVSANSGRFDLQLSGHTHGGQILLPFLGQMRLPRMGRKYPSGMYRIKKMVLYTNRGIGTALVRIRINCPPEITMFTLRAGPGNLPK